MKSKRGTEVHRSKCATGSKTEKILLELKYRKIRRCCEEDSGAGVAFAKPGLRVGVGQESGYGFRRSVWRGNIKVKRAYFERVRVRNMSFARTCGQ
jgi:hypothetical protein